MQKIFHAAQGILFGAKINKQSAKAICRFERLRTLHSKRQKAIQVLKKLSFAHAFNYIVLRINPGPTSCEDIATEIVYHTMYIYTINQNQQSFTCL